MSKVGWRKCAPVLSDEAVVAMRYLAWRQVPVKKIATEFGVNYQTTYNAVRGHTWRHVQSVKPVPAPFARKVA